MTSLALASILERVIYVNPIKIGVVAVLAVVWAAGAQWIDRDTDVVKTKREQWNLIVVSGAAVAYIVLFIPPWQGIWFFVAMAFWFLIVGGSMFAYVIHRNGRVASSKRVLTTAHLKRKILGDTSKRKAVKDKGQRLQLADHMGKHLEFPADEEEALAFQAVQDFLYDLLWRRASDMEMLAGKERYRVVYRVDGVATELVDGLPTEEGERILCYLKRNAGLDVEELRRPQTGRIKVALLTHSGNVEFSQVRTSGTTAGERLRVRFQAGPVVFRLHELGLPQQRLEVMKKEVMGKPTGLFLMGAPPHDGLTTTQYAVVRSHDAYMHNIHAVERRPLTELDNITQHVFDGANTDVNYARMLQSVLRREPDIVMVGECEDRETAQLATRAAADDRKIYLGIHATDSFDALSKYLAFVDDNALAAKALCGVMSQRLVRVLCEQCREAYRPDEATLKKLNLPADKIERFYRPPSEPKLDRKGKEIPCANCQGTGYVGRKGVYELLVVDEAISKLIEAGAPINRIRAQCRKNRMYYLQEEGLLKVIDGTTSMNEILRCLRSEGT